MDCQFFVQGTGVSKRQLSWELTTLGLSCMPFCEAGVTRAVLVNVCSPRWCGVYLMDHRRSWIQEMCLKCYLQRIMFPNPCFHFHDQVAMLIPQQTWCKSRPGNMEFVFSWSPTCFFVAQRYHSQHCVRLWRRDAWQRKCLESFLFFTAGYHLNPNPNTRY